MTAASPLSRRLAAPGIALAAGAASVPGFAPLYLFPLPILALAVLAWLGNRAATARAAAHLGFWFAFGLFACGVWWIYTALHVYGAMPPVVALAAVAAFAAYLALYPALALYVAKRFFAGAWWLAFPACWALAEWLRGWIFTGFPWLALGYSQVPWSPLSGFGPLVGAYGVSLAAAASAAAIAALLHGGRRMQTAAAALALWIGGAVLQQIPWTRAFGEPLEVSLVQGNVAQELKFREDQLIGSLRAYESLVLETRSRLVILPETALPLLRHEVPAAYLDRLALHVRSSGGDLVLGVFENDPPGSARYFNAAMSLGTAPQQSYRKNHLVPFGEFIPLKPLVDPIVRGLLAIPLSDQTPGGADQLPLEVAGQRLAVNICYEDVFGEEIIRQLPRATMLANITNDAWYGESWAAEQHLQMSQMRALETGRVMLRATNTGLTAAVDHRGRVLASLPEFRQAVLTVRVQGRAGATPYVRAGNVPAVLVSLALLAVAWHRVRRDRP
jgi:apolipoprotein N-acyltransferase